MHDLANTRYGFLAAAMQVFNHPAQSAETVPCLPRVRGMPLPIPRKSIVHFSIFKYIQCMILTRRRHLHQLTDLLTRYPIVALVGARQVGKTTLARQLIAHTGHPSILFDLEIPIVLARLADPTLALQAL